MKYLLIVKLLLLSLITTAQSSERQIIEVQVSTNYNAVSKSLILTSSEISSQQVFDENANKWITLYTYNNSTNKAPYGFSIYSGWAFYGDCLVYGWFFIGSNNVTHFEPCQNCYGFDMLCPAPGMGLARLNFKYEKTK